MEQPGHTVRDRVYILLTVQASFFDKGLLREAFLLGIKLDIVEVLL
jgi:hypothetical protein